jgi:ethanolamine ammonia-lyase small subunit
MKRVLIASTIALLVCAAAGQAQDSLSTTRIGAQHKATSSQGKRLEQTEAALLNAIKSENPDIQAQALQTIRDLEQMYPKYSFKASLAPLAARLKDENADSTVRLLTALVLDELHSEAGDAVIADVARSSQDKGLQNLCKALMVRSQYR